MCIAIVKKIEGVITDAALKNGFAKNPHGAGFSYVAPEGHVVTRKGFFDVDKFITEYREAETQFGAQSPFLLHCRWATTGPKVPDNCHPFNFKHGAMMHNGHFFTAQGDKSDSREFAEDMGEYFSKENVQKYMKPIEDAVGFNKIGILFKDRTFAIVNERSGIWENNVWYSNDSFRPLPPLRNFHRESGMPAPGGMLPDATDAEWVRSFGMID